MASQLRIARDLSLPLDAVTGTFVIVGIRGSGKSTVAVCMAEEMLRAKQQIVVLDPKDDWYGLKSRGERGEEKGFPIAIFGGRKGDVPLESTAGRLIADLIVEQNLSCILSTRHFSDGQRFQFIYDLATRLYQTVNEPMHLFIDEADQVAPQEKQNKIQKGDKVSESMMLSLVRRLIKQGRTGGLGISLITQSPATLDKRVMNMCETLIAMRTIGAQDLKAVNTWVSAWATNQQQHDETMAALPTFRTGTGLFWSPAWLETYKIVEFRRADTFDSRATPKVGHRRVEPKVLADVDIEKLKEEMAETIERAENEDPKKLRLRIADLEARLRDRPNAGDPELEAEVGRLRESVETLQSDARAWMQKAADRDRRQREFVTALLECIDRFEPQPDEAIDDEAITRLDRQLGLAADGGIEERGRRSPKRTKEMRNGANGAGAAAAREQPPARKQAEANGTSAPGLTAAETKILAALATHPNGRTKIQLARLAHYHPDSRPFRDALPALESRRMLRKDGDRYQPTSAGLIEAGDRRASISFTKAEDAILKSARIVDAARPVEGAPRADSRVQRG